MSQKGFNKKVNLKGAIWKRIETNYGEELPPCIIKILEEVGYSTSMSISSIQPADIECIEEFVNGDLRHILNELTCCNSETYKNQNEFRLLPGHRNMILNLKNYLQETQVDKPSFQLKSHSSVFSFLLSEIIRTAETNASKVPTQYRYSEIIRWFAVYIYMTCGKLCYETLCRNLPLPQPSSICKQLISLVSFSCHLLQS